MGKRPNMHPHKPHAPSQSSRLSHTYRPSTQLFGSGSAWLVHSCVCGFRGNAWPLLLSLCYMENKTSARHRLERQCNACDNCKKQCRHKETKPNSNAIHPRKRHNNPTNSHTPSRIKSTHTRRTYTGIQPHAPGQQAGDHPVPAHTSNTEKANVLIARCKHK